jgi:hypothetical protein
MFSSLIQPLPTLLSGVVAGGGGGIADTARFGSITAANTPLPYGTVGSAYTYAGPQTIVGGNGTYTFTLNGTLPTGLTGCYSGRTSTLPNGLTFNPATGGITGTPTANGYFWGWITITDSAGKLGFFPISISCGPAYSSVAPSGDATGATDTAAINAVLATGGRVRLNGTYYLNNSLVIYANSGIITAPSTVINLTLNSNCPMVKNPNQSTQTRTDTNLMIWDEGSGGTTTYWNGLFASQSTHLKQNSGMIFASVAGLFIKGGKITAELTAINAAGVMHADYNGSQIFSTNVVNQDGYDFFNGSNHFYVREIPALQVADDGLSWAAKTAQSTSSILYGNGWQDGADVHDAWAENIAFVRQGNYARQAFRLQQGNGFYMYNIKGRNFTSSDAAQAPGARRFLMVGKRGYVTGPLSDPAHDWNVEFENLRDFQEWVSFDADMNGLRIEGINQNLQLTHGLWVSQDETSTYQPIVQNVYVSGITDNYVGTHSEVINFISGSTVSNVTVINGALTALSRFNNTVASISNLVINGWIIGTPTNPLFNSTVPCTGTLSTFTITNPIPITYGTVCGLTLSTTAPNVRPFDTVPSPVNGSTVIFTNGTSPADVYQALGGTYVGNGSTWVLSGTQSNIPYPTPTTYYEDDFTGTPGNAMSGRTPLVGAGYSAVSGGSTNTAVIGGGGVTVRSAASTNASRSQVLSPGNNLAITCDIDFVATLANDQPSVIWRVSGSQATFLMFRWNQATSAWQFFNFVNNVATQVGSDIAGTFTSGTKHITITDVVDNLVTPTQSTINISVDGTPVITNLVQSAVLIAGYSGFRISQTQGASTGRQISYVKAATI